jgi:signal peptidase II
MTDTGAGAEVGPARRSWWPVSVLIAVVWVVLDQLTKHWAVNELADGRTVELVWTLRFNLAFNSGMAFSQAEGIGPVIGAVALVVVVVLLVSLRRQESLLSAVAVGLIVGGASGNLIDRLVRGEGWLRGSVVDFIDLQWWPIFNIADIGITVGGALLIVGAFRRGSVEAHPA